MPDENLRIAALRRGEVHLITDLTPNGVKTLKQVPRVVLVSHSVSRLFVLKASADRSPFNSARVRQALVTTLNKRGLVDLLTDGKGLIADSIFYPLMSSYLRLPETASNPKESFSLLRQAGYPAPVEVTLGYATSGPGDRGQLAQLIQRQLADGGFHVDLESSPSEVTLRKTSHLILSSFSNLTFDPVASVRWLTEDMRTIGYADPTLTDFISKARAQPTSEANYRDIQRRVWEDMVIVPILFEPAIAAQDARLSGAELLPNGFISLEALSFKQ